MIVKFYAGKTCFRAINFFVVSAPGVGDLIFIPYDGIWTGDCHIYSKSKLSINIGNIDCVETRSNDDESDEEWKTLFKRKNMPFSYNYEKKLEKLIIKLSKIG